ncbi:hypothetical protein JOQ06_016430 [Pogonophryne albipinna]|uniref:SET domain-containing protein n=1 Tax=Pogonophryne albipinna TaxID=1090488 RepID=A0AAD6F7F8_9TELE|nr:hypothetical protein JOQ06_016430 [Pogonophryne albipinna]
MMRSTRGLNPCQEAERQIRMGKDKDNLRWEHINTSKGRGVFAKSHIFKGAFILQYRGILRKGYSGTNDYSYHFRHGGSHYCKHNVFNSFFSDTCSIDASSEDGSMGRLVNDDPKPNGKMKKMKVDGVPQLCIFAVKDIMEGQEITYDYGGVDLPWRSSPGQEMAKVSTTDLY